MERYCKDCGNKLYEWEDENLDMIGLKCNFCQNQWLFKDDINENVKLIDELNKLKEENITLKERLQKIEKLLGI